MCLRVGRAEDRFAVAVARVIFALLPLEVQYERFRRTLNSNSSINDILVNERKSLAVICVPFAANHLIIPNELNMNQKKRPRQAY